VLCVVQRILQLFFAKVSRSASEDDVQQLFQQFGQVQGINLFRAFQVRAVGSRQFGHLAIPKAGPPFLDACPASAAPSTCWVSCNKPCALVVAVLRCEHMGWYFQVELGGFGLLVIWKCLQSCWMTFALCRVPPSRRAVG
jgi:hypothetical protein